MCIAIWKPKGTVLTEDTLENCWDNNPDGAGFMYVEKRKLQVVKGLMSFYDFKDAYLPHEHKEMVLHFRIATHGGVNAENTHPFLIDDNLAMVHNGVLQKVDCDIDPTRSDTWHFVEKFLKEFYLKDKTFWMKESYKELIEEYIGNSKFILMDSRGNADIYNAKQGQWDSKCWFSNISYKWKRNIVHKSYSSPQKKYLGDDYGNNSFDATIVHPFKEGDWAILKYEAKIKNSLSGLVIPAETKVVVIYKFTTYMEIEVVGSQVRAEVPFWKLEACPKPVPLLEDTTLTPVSNVIEMNPFKEGDEIVFAQNYNHFRIGDKKKIRTITLNHVIVDDLTRNKAFAIPKGMVRPSIDLLM